MRLDLLEYLLLGDIEQGDSSVDSRHGNDAAIVGED
jgi:hypothetical protein